MDREAFIKGMERESMNSLSEEEIRASIPEAIDAMWKGREGMPRGHMDLIVVMEELAELTQEVSKYLRGKGDNVGLLEELADVQFCIWYVQEICGIRDETLAKACSVKANRVKNRILMTGRYE